MSEVHENMSFVQIHENMKLFGAFDAIAAALAAITLSIVIHVLSKSQNALRKRSQNRLK